MLRLTGGTHFLSLIRKPEGKHLVDIRERFDDVISSWTPASRVSPVFPVNGMPVPNLRDGTRRWLLFAGPLFPGMINPDDFPYVFLSLGLFNIIIFSDDKLAAQHAIEFAEQSDVQWEQWTLDGNCLIEFVCSSYDADGSIPAEILMPIIGLSDALKPTIREYTALLATAVGRSANYARVVQNDLIQFDKLFRELLSRTDLDVVAKQGQLVIANAVLSRHTSQTYTGISPIVETECHFSTHSLLGIGIPSIALVHLRQFIERVFTESHLNARLRALDSIPPGSHDLLGLSGTSEYWDTEHLFRPEIELELDNGKESDAALPLLTCYSGRDGFRSTKLSLSAPLEVITSCNAVAWTPLTITHEISHTLIDGALGILMPRPDSPPDINKAITLIASAAHSEGKVSSMLDQLQRFLCHHLLQLHDHQIGCTRTEICADDLARIIRAEWADLNETLTHVFDFLYFYQRDPKLYIPSIWASWGVIPNIQSCVPAYIVRTLCAIHSINLRDNNSLNLSISQLVDFLSKTQEKHPNSLIKSALMELDQRKDYYHLELRMRVPFVKFVRGFLFQPRIAQNLFRESMLLGGERNGYQLKTSEFDDMRISNPIRFATAYTTDLTPKSPKSAWILYHLAFCM